MLSELNLVAGDLLPHLSINYDGVDISGYQKIELRLRLQDGKTVTKTAVIDDGPAGLFHFEWSDGDLVPGIHAADLYFEDEDGNALTLPAEQAIRVNVRRRS